jgi:hypothetical protein
MRRDTFRSAPPRSDMFLRLAPIYLPSTRCGQTCAHATPATATQHPQHQHTPATHNKHMHTTQEQRREREREREREFSKGQAESQDSNARGATVNPDALIITREGRDHLVWERKGAWKSATNLRCMDPSGSTFETK